jgi:DNA-binding transcriptional LysR family regulator
VRLADLEGARLIVPPAGRPHREQVERALAAAGVAWERAVEASGWPLMLHYASLGVGLAIVNDICPVPRGCVARPLPELAPLAYYVLHRDDLGADDPAAALARAALDAFRRARTSSV